VSRAFRALWAAGAVAVILPACGAAQTRPSRAVTPPPADTSRFRAPVKVCAGGDVTLGTNLNPVWSARAADSLRRFFNRDSDPSALVASLRPVVAGADLVLLNIEAAIGSGPAPAKCGPRSTACFAFRQDPAAAPAIRGVVVPEVVVVGNLANNHSRDAGEAGFDATRAHLETAGIVTTGADTLATPVITAAGDTIAFLGFHTSSESPDARDLAAVRRHVTRAVRDFGTVIVTMHLGAEGLGAQRTRNVVERYVGENRGNPVAFANTVLTAGATMVVGHGPHVLRAMEWRGRRLVAYSLGNLLTYGPFRNREPANRGAVLCATIEGPRLIARAELRPTRQLAPGVLEVDPDRRAFSLVDSLSRLDFPRTGVSVSPTGAVLPRSR
jgi:hypothetical protein